MTDIKIDISTRAPRYTSYPPATQFTDAIGAQAATDWLEEIPPGARVSVDVHIPFCRRLCWFCACRTQGTQTDGPLAAYLDTLRIEIDLVADRLPADVDVGRIHLGGGIPTLLPPKMLSRLFRMLDARLPRAPGSEISVEIDPTEVDDARLDALLAAGLTRASLGVQDFDPAVQRAIGRSQTIDQTRTVIEALRACGIGGINLDLLYGLPRQTAATLDTVIDLGPDRIALYGYAHVPWASRRQVMIQEADLPDLEERRALPRLAAARLHLAGYRGIGFDHFAQPGDALARAAETGALRRNFQGYTVDPSDILIGLGASAISRLPGGYAQDAARTSDWTARLHRGRLPTMRGHALTKEDRLRGAVIERLLCDFAINPADFDTPADVRDMTADLAWAWPGSVERDWTGALVVCAQARDLLRLIAMTLDRYVIPDSRHSLTI